MTKHRFWHRTTAEYHGEGRAIIACARCRRSWIEWCCALAPARHSYECNAAFERAVYGQLL